MFLLNISLKYQGNSHICLPWLGFHELPEEITDALRSFQPPFTRGVISDARKVIPIIEGLECTNSLTAQVVVMGGQNLPFSPLSLAA